ncbi:hypothetical protein BDW69DRAFT_168037 [Aspergillus filifer]
MLTSRAWSMPMRSTVLTCPCMLSLGIASFVWIVASGCSAVTVGTVVEVGVATGWRFQIWVSIARQWPLGSRLSQL